jgi:hypothetical protein
LDRQKRASEHREQSRARVKEAAVLDPPAGTQDFAARALDDVVPGIVAEAAQPLGGRMPS